MNHLFLDTNIFLHFRDFDQIDWAALLNSNGPFEFMIAPAVMAELDAHKYNASKRVSRIAKKILPRIEQIIENPTLCRYGVNYIIRQPRTEIFDLYQLDKNVKDDCLLASIKQYINEEKKDPVYFVTHDVGPRLKAQQLGITTIRLPEEFMLPEELEDVEKKNKALTNELAELKKRLPVLKLVFKDGNEFLHVNARQEIVGRAQYVEREMAKLRSEISYLTYFETDASADQTGLRAAFAFHASLMGLSKDQVKDYNKELDNYFEKSKIFFAQEYDVYLFRYNMEAIKLTLKNSGTTPAEDIDIELHIPDGPDVLAAKDVLKHKKRPEEPHRPKNRFDFYSPVISNILSPLRLSEGVSSINQITREPSIKKTNSYNVKFHHAGLKHHQEETFHSFYLKYNDIRKAENFSMSYKLTVANLPQPVTGNLHVKFEK
ncbi:MAG: hypothetical protein JWN76_1577 [Chitinophagaceae bacterium]|nr:hypothetical protein [Chitinophagaceae bacterium]